MNESSAIFKINNEEFENKHNFLSEGLLSPGMNHTDCNRLQMFDSHITQAIQIDKSEIPLVFTNFENQIGNYSSGFQKLKGEYKVLKKIYKNKLNYAMIIENTKTKILDVVFRTEGNWLTEHYGYKNFNSMDRLNENDTIRNKTLSRSRNYDSFMNFQYGTNLNAVYLAYKGFTNEDSIVISESTRKKLSSYFVKVVTISVNTNDLLLNRYGNKKFYKTFPDIGEYTNDNILAVRRRINYERIFNRSY